MAMFWKFKIWFYFISVYPVSSTPAIEHCARDCVNFGVAIFCELALRLKHILPQLVCLSGSPYGTITTTVFGTSNRRITSRVRTLRLHVPQRDCGSSGAQSEPYR